MKKRFRCTGNHPTLKKLGKLFQYAEDLGISIDFPTSHGTVQVTDRGNRTQYFLENIDQDGGDVESPYEIPPPFEYKLVYEEDVKEEAKV